MTNGRPVQPLLVRSRSRDGAAVSECAWNIAG